MPKTTNRNSGSSGRKNAVNTSAAPLSADLLPDLDDFYQLGLYTGIVCLFAELLILAQVGNMLFMTYAGAAPTVLACGTYKFADTQSAIERCALVESDDLNMREQYNCSHATLMLHSQFLSVNEEFHYICQTQLVKTTISVQMVGVVVGSALFGWLGDRYGRKRTMQWALVGCVSCMLGAVFTNDLLAFTIARFLVNFFNAGTMVLLMVFTSEHYPKQQRFCLSNLITWSPNFVLFALMAWSTRSWRLLQLASALGAVPCILLLDFLNESPRFLLQCRRDVNMVREAIVRMHRIDGRHCDLPMLNAVLEREQRALQEEETSPKQKTYNYFHLFYTGKFTRYTLAVAFSFLAVSLMNYSLLYNMEMLSGSLYTNCVLLGLFRYSMNLAVAFLDLRIEWFGRKVAHFLANGLAAGALFVHLLIDLFALQPEFPLLHRATIIAVIGFCSLLFTTNGLVANELFPTGIRAISYSFGQVMSRVGVVLAPQLFMLSNISTWLPHLTMLCLALADAIFFQLNVVETKNRPLESSFPGRAERIFH